MSNRFSTKSQKKNKKHNWGRLLYLLLPVLLISFWYLASSVKGSTSTLQEESLRDAINRDVLHCYALEGYYTPSLEYLEEHYGLKYDKSTFAVNYQPIASNIRPDVTILVIKQKK